MCCCFDVNVGAAGCKTYMQHTTIHASFHTARVHTPAHASCMYTRMSAACICTYTYTHTCCRHTFTHRLIVLVESLPDIQAPAYLHILRLFAHRAVTWNAWRAQRAECKCACRDVSSEHATQKKKKNKRVCLCCLFTHTFTRTHKDRGEIQSHPKYSHTDTISHKSLTRHSRRPPPPPSPQIHTHTSRTFAEERVRRKT